LLSTISPIPIAWGEEHRRILKQQAFWYEKAAEQGDANAQHNLAVCHVYGFGVLKDYAKAVSWYRRAAEQDHAPGQHGLGLCYRNGQGVACDPVQAYIWFQLAADQGDAPAEERTMALAASMPSTHPEIAWRLYREFKEKGAAKE
jgi:TPR repeat protein